jgi:hypothetical protein
MVMSDLTVRDVGERMKEIDLLLFMIDTAQISMSWEEYCALKIEADALMKLLAEELAKEMNRPFEVVIKDLKIARHLDRLEMTIERHKFIYPVPDPAHDAIIKSAFGDSTKSDAQVTAELDTVFGYMFANAPTDPNPPVPRKSFFQRLFDK